MQLRIKIMHPSSMHRLELPGAQGSKAPGFNKHVANYPRQACICLLHLAVFLFFMFLCEPCFFFFFHRAAEKKVSPFGNAASTKKKR